ncbi:hypothetical protein BC830DRAFT_1174445 [Chytriomyces sp. MP71]|nr:hypothetical protein BC830DRAFT_1174445 [Chytriomyces sp. MP71]
MTVDKAKLLDSYSEFDSHPNGKLSLAEIDKALIHVAPELAKDKPAIMRAYKAADSKKSDGFIEKDEFEGFVTLLIKYDKIYKMFQAVDKDGDRRITFDEFEKGRKKLGISAGEARADFDKIDNNGGGIILFDEFCAYLSRF